MARAVRAVGIPCGLRFDRVGELGVELTRMLGEEQVINRPVGGEGVLVVDDRCVGVVCGRRVSGC